MRFCNVAILNCVFGCLFVFVGFFVTITLTFNERLLTNCKSAYCDKCDNLETHTHTHTHMYVCMYIYIYIYVCVCVCVYEGQGQT